jgi:hypothetical protein
MFGLKLKAFEKGEPDFGKAGWKLASAGVHIRLTNEISALMGTLLDNAGIDDDEAAKRLQNCIDCQEGVDAVLVKDLAPLSLKIADGGQIRAGAWIAHNARNSVLISGRFDFEAAQEALKTAMCAKR